VKAQGNCNVTCDVFTTGFNHVCTISQTISRDTTVSWDLKDKSGCPCSNGLYYIRVSVNGAGGISSEILKALLLR
jgi:hypothetical protein